MDYVWGTNLNSSNVPIIVSNVRFMSIFFISLNESYICYCCFESLWIWTLHLNIDLRPAVIDRMTFLEEQVKFLHIQTLEFFPCILLLRLSELPTFTDATSNTGNILNDQCEWMKLECYLTVFTEVRIRKAAFLLCFIWTIRSKSHRYIKLKNSLLSWKTS